MFITVNGRPVQTPSGVQSQFAQRAPDPQLSMIHSSDQTLTQLTQVTHRSLNPKLSVHLLCFSTFLLIYCFSLFSCVVFVLQAEDADIKYSVSGVTRDSAGTDSGLWDTVDSEDLLLATDTPPPFSEDFSPPSDPCSPPLSPPDQALARLSRPASSEPTNQRESPPMDTCDLRYHTSSVWFSPKRRRRFVFCVF